MHLDSDTQLNACKEDEFITVWQFDNSEESFLADYGPSTMKLFNPENKSYSDEVIFKKISQLDESIPTLAGGDAGVMKFPRFKISEGLKVRHNTDANGDFTNAGLVSDYSLVVDVLWPSACVANYRPLLQTSLNYESEIEDEKRQKFALNQSKESALLAVLALMDFVVKCCQILGIESHWCFIALHMMAPLRFTLMGNWPVKKPAVI